MTDNDIDTDGPLEELITDAEQHREQYTEARDRLQEVRERLFALVDDLVAEGAIASDEADRINGLIENGKYEQARDAIREAREEGLQFDDDEKDAFAREFADTWSEMHDVAETVATALLQFERDVDREDMVAYLYGKHSGLNKGDIRAVFDAFDTIPEGGLSTREMARMLAAFNHDLNIEPTVDVLEAIKEDSR